MAIHSFDTSDAKAYGFPCAVLLHNLRFWIFHNWTNGKHEFDGRTWTYNSAKAYAQQFPYLSEDQIQRALKKLVDGGVILRRVSGEDKWDRTNWYAFVDQAEQLKDLAEPEKSDSAKSRNARRKDAVSTPQSRAIDGAELRNHCTDVNHRSNPNEKGRAALKEILPHPGESQEVYQARLRASGEQAGRGTEGSRAALGEALALLKGKVVSEVPHG